MRQHRAWTALLLPLLLSACSSLLPQSEPLDIYRLPVAHNTAVAASDTSPAPSIELRVKTPQASGMLDSKRIVVVPAGDRISVYHGARWNQPTPQLLRDRIIQAFRDTGRLHAVFSDDNSIHADYTLSGTLDAFQAEYRGEKTPSVVISFNALLIRNIDQKVVATHHINIINRTEDTAIPTVVDALGEATDQLNAKLTSWALEHMTPAKGRAPAP